MGVRGTGRAWVLLAALLAGCGRAPEPPVDTGAREAARNFYEGLVRQDWQRSYAALHADSRKRWTADEFARRAQAYRRDLGFDPEEARVQSCSEEGEQAVAHVVLTGHSASQARRYRDAVTLRRGPDGWRVVLPEGFGRRLR